MQIVIFLNYYPIFKTIDQLKASIFKPHSTKLYFLPLQLFIKMNTLFTIKIKKYWQQYFELLFWASALLLLFFMRVNTEAPTLCIFRWLGINQCPGCGLGHSINAVLHLHFSASFKYHPMGIFAVIIILNRIKQLSFKPKYIIQ